MKEHAKKALKHDTKVLGKTVPTMLIIGLFLVGGGSAAILSSFGTVSGTADVESQAISLNEEPDVTVDGEAAPENKWVSTTAVNNNPNETVYYNWELTENTDDVTNTGAFSSVIFDVEDTFTVETEADSGDTFTVEVGYDNSTDELTFSVPSITDYSNGAGAVIYFDTNGDGNYNFHVDMGSSGEAGDVWKWDAENQEWDGVHDFTQNPVEYQGISHTSATDKSTHLSALSDVNVTVDADKFSTEFRVAAHDYGDTAKGKSNGDSSSYGLQSFPQVDGSEVALNGGSHRNYALVVEANSGASSSDSYTAIAKATPVVN